MKSSHLDQTDSSLLIYVQEIFDALLIMNYVSIVLLVIFMNQNGSAVSKYNKSEVTFLYLLSSKDQSVICTLQLLFCICCPQNIALHSVSSQDKSLLSITTRTEILCQSCVPHTLAIFYM